MYAQSCILLPIQTFTFALDGRQRLLCDVRAAVDDQEMGNIR